jgi:hypothetical protein
MGHAHRGPLDEGSGSAPLHEAHAGPPSDAAPILHPSLHTGEWSGYVRRYFPQTWFGSPAGE